jgi:hypothetical protein
MVENSLLGAHVYMYSFHIPNGNQFSNIMFILLKSRHIKTRAATFASQGTWYCENKKITKNEENNLFSSPCFLGKNFHHAVNGRYQP